MAKKTFHVQCQSFDLPLLPVRQRTFSNRKITDVPRGKAPCIKKNSYQISSWTHPYVLKMLVTCSVSRTILASTSLSSTFGIVRWSRKWRPSTLYFPFSNRRRIIRSNREVVWHRISANNRYMELPKNCFLKITGYIAMRPASFPSTEPHSPQRTVCLIQ